MLARLSAQHDTLSTFHFPFPLFVVCGIIAVSGYQDVIQDLYDGLIILQHRGQDAAGIVTYNNQFHLKKSNGMVQDVFHSKSLARLRGTMGIGHVRYPTAGCSSEFEAQPFFVNSPFGIAMAHNGNLTNEAEVRKELLEKQYRHLNTNSDSEAILNVFAVAECHVDHERQQCHAHR